MHAAVLYHFEAVAHAGSIRETAERRDVAASVINRQIRKLEDQLSATLSVIAAPLVEPRLAEIRDGLVLPRRRRPLLRTRR
jgi:DNA-binding transcriptional LysR family regulator